MDTTFISKVTKIATAWLQDINDFVYKNIGSSSGATLVGWIYAAANSVAATIQNWIDWQTINVFGFMTVAQIADVRAGTLSLDLTTPIANAVAAVPTYGALRFPYGKYLGVISVRKSNITLVFDGCYIKQPAATNHPAVLELGDLASGNSATAYSGINIRGNVLLDGNKSSITAPTSDVTGWGFAATKISNSDWGDGIRAQNCYNGGFGAVIDSNYNKGTIYVESCGNATYTNPGFDINSSKHSTYKVISNSCYVGARILDNCWGVTLEAAIYNSTKDGFIYNNQSTNSSNTNNINVTVYTAGQHGVNIGENCTDSPIKATVYNATNYGCIIGDGTAHPSARNIIDLITSGCGAAGLYINTDGNDNTIRHNTNLDGRTGAQGTSFAVDINGNRNKLIVDLIDSSTWQVRGIAVRSGASDTEILSYSYTNTGDPFNDAGTRTKFNHGEGRGADIASASTITIPLMGSIFHVTGTTGITTIAGSGEKDRKVSFIFDGILTVTKGSNIKLGAGGNLTTTANSTLDGIWDGTNFYETGRSVV